MLNAQEKIVVRQIARELDTMHDQLSADVRPGHPDYVSKLVAAEWAAVLGIRLEKLFPEAALVR